MISYLKFWEILRTSYDRSSVQLTVVAVLSAPYTTRCQTVRSVALGCQRDSDRIDATVKHLKEEIEGLNMPGVEWFSEVKRGDCVIVTIAVPDDTTLTQVDAEIHIVCSELVKRAI